MQYIARGDVSLVARPLPTYGEGPGIHYMYMCQSDTYFFIMKTCA